MSTTTTLVSSGDSTLIKAVLPLVGVFVGFTIGELSRILRERSRRTRLCKQIRDELKTNLHFIPQKKDILQKSLRAMQSAEILDTNSIPFCDTIYEGHYSEIAPFLSALERNVIHVIYHGQGIIQKCMDGYEPELRSQESVKQIALMNIFRIKFQDLVKQLGTQELLIKSVLDGSPIDVAHLGMDYAELKKSGFQTAK